jgi:uncharacterized protein (TIRG00374 family)
MPATVLVGGLALGALALAGLWRYENAIIRWLGGQLQRVGPARRHRLPARLRLARRMTRRVLSDSVHSSAWLLRERRGSLAAVFVLAAIQWSCRYGVLPLLLVAYGCHRNPLPLLVLQGLIMVFSVVAVMPGGGGSVEVVSAFLLRGFVPLSAVGMVLLLWRLFTYHLYLLAGGAMFLWLVR